MNQKELKSFLDQKVSEYNQSSFIETDPIKIPKQFSLKENIEISAFFASTLAWGSRTVIIRNAARLMVLMNNQPFNFITNFENPDDERITGFRHRTFNGIDCNFFVRSLKNIYSNHGGLQKVFETGFSKDGTIQTALQHFHSVFFEIKSMSRTLKHISDVSRGASAKRLNLFLRWMVRNDIRGIDFGIWRGIPASALMLPLDIHTGNVARKLGLLTRKSNDWAAVEEVTSRLRLFDPDDPVKYDFALFGLGAFENF